TAIDRAIADRNDPFRLRRRRVRALERFLHVARERAGHEQHVCMARRSDETNAEALDIVDRIVERVDLELATVARARVDFTDREAPTQAPTRGRVELERERSELGVDELRRRLGDRTLHDALEQEFAHRLRWPTGRVPNTSS